MVQVFHEANKHIIVMYNSGTDGHYISKADQKQADLPILRQSTKRVGIANGGTSKTAHVTQLPVERLLQ